MDYAYSVAPHQKYNLNNLQRVQNYAARIITGKFDYINNHNIDVLRSKMGNCRREVWLFHYSSYL